MRQIPTTLALWLGGATALCACTGVNAVGAAPDGGELGEATDATPAADREAHSAFRVLLSEVMYHPVVDDAPDSTYEFIEIYNAMPTEVDLAGWQLMIDRTPAFTFPAGARIRPMQYLVLAKDRARLLAVPAYALVPDSVLGDYSGELANGDSLVQLLDATGAPADAFKYDDELPWPVSPDALGAGEKWFAAPDPRADFAKHQRVGVSLERRRFDVAATDVGNWSPSKLDGATPGLPNGTVGAQRPVVEQLTAVPKQGDWPIRGGDDVVIHVRFSPMWSRTTGAALEYFVDDVKKSGEPVTSIVMDADGDGWSATLPATINAENAVVRYRIKADSEGTNQVVSPRPFTGASAGDPNPWHAYFVHSANVVADIGKGKAVYQLFISPDNWGKMWINTGGLATDTTHGIPRRTTGPLGTEENGCTLRPDYDALVPAIFVADGRVYDVLTRYQGSQFNRLNGEQVKTWPRELGPAAGPNPPTVLSWHLGFPRSTPFVGPLGEDFAGKRTGLDIKKANYPSCQAFANYTSNKLMEAVGLASARVKLVRTYINGRYFSYMADQGPMDDTIVLRTDPASRPTKTVGELFKADGFYWGPGGVTDFSPLTTNPFCSGAPDSHPACDDTHPAPLCSTQSVGWSNEVWQRYQLNYQRQTHDWKEAAIARDPEHPKDDAQILLEGLEKARADDGAPPAGQCPADDSRPQKVTNRRKFLTDNFDLARLRDYIAIRNWAGAEDDAHHNYYLYRKASDGKWFIIGWDFEFEYGGMPALAAPGFTPTMSFYIGEDCDRSSTRHWNRIKDAYLKSFRADYHRRLRELSRPGQILHADSIRALMDGLSREIDMDDWNEAAIAPPPEPPFLSTYQCKPADFLDAVNTWAKSRNAELEKQIPP